MNLFAILCELERREIRHCPTSLANVNNSIQNLLLWNMTMAGTRNIKCTFVSCLSCAGQAILAVSTAGHGCACGPRLGTIRPAGERTACLLLAAAELIDP